MGSLIPFDPFAGTVDALVAKLMDTFGYPPEAAQFVAPQIRLTSGAVRDAFRRYWLTRRCEPDLAVNGISLCDLVSSAHLHPVAALLALDDLQKNPREARARIARLCAPVLLSSRQLAMGDFHASFRVRS